MCASYWNLDTKIKCPDCGKTTLWNLTTHFMGYVGSYSHVYKLGEEIPELEGVNVLLDGRIDNFNGHCGKKVWILKEYMRAANLVKSR